MGHAIVIFASSVGEGISPAWNFVGQGGMQFSGTQPACPFYFDICHFLISPFTPPTFTAFSFYAPTVRVAYLQQADTVCSVAVATPQLRGPPQG